MRQPAAKRHGGQGQLRIIGGEWRSRRFAFPDAPGLRPTPDRVRETLFNWLAPYVQGARVLDPFAGSGALYLEALSRGASQALALDLNAEAIASLRQHLDTLNCGAGQLLQSHVHQVTWSIFAASTKSLRVSPSTLCVQIVMRTLPQARWMSG